MFKSLIAILSVMIATVAEATPYQKVFCTSSRSTIHIDLSVQSEGRAQVDIQIIFPGYAEYHGFGEVIDTERFAQMKLATSKGFLLIDKNLSVEGTNTNATLVWQNLDPSIFGQKDFKCYFHSK